MRLTVPPLQANGDLLVCAVDAATGGRTPPYSIGGVEVVVAAGGDGVT
jgi:diacylglycerol kinase family enzyme